MKARGKIGNTPEVQAAREAYLKSKGHNSLRRHRPGTEECYKIMMGAPGQAAMAHFSSHTQQLMWDRTRRAKTKEWNYWLDELDKAQARGPGKLELNPKLVIPIRRATRSTSSPAAPSATRSAASSTTTP